MLVILHRFSRRTKHQPEWWWVPVIYLKVILVTVFLHPFPSFVLQKIRLASRAEISLSFLPKILQGGRPKQKKSSFNYNILLYGWDDYGHGASIWPRNKWEPCEGEWKKQARESFSLSLLSGFLPTHSLSSPLLSVVITCVSKHRSFSITK